MESMNYTSIEQSKKLLELGLNPDSADMHWRKGLVKDSNGNIPWFAHNNTRLPVDYGDEDNLPCWSVGALLEVMPNHTEVTKIDGLWTISANGFGDVQSDSLIDALVDKMILLLENNYIKKGE